MARRADERGDATVETVMAVPVVLFLIMVVIQAGLWFHGAQIVEAAAQALSPAESRPGHQQRPRSAPASS